LLSRDADTEIWLLGLGAGRQRLGGSILSQCFDAFGGAAPDLDDPQRLRRLFELVRDARQAGLLLAYHDRSDGGALAALCEMAFCSHLGLDISLEGWGGDRADDVCRTLFNEELGAIVQIRAEHRAEFADLVARHGLIECAQRIARPSTAPAIRITDDGKTLVEWHWETLFDAWWSTSHAMQKLRDDPACADEERAAVRRFDAPGLQPKVTFDPAEDVAAPFVNTGAARGNPARAGRQRADRDGVGHRAQQLRGRRRAHERPGRRTRGPAGVRRHGRLRRFQLRRRARRRTRLGDLDTRARGAARHVRG